METELLSRQIQVERKLFTFTLRENLRGKFLRITEDVGGHRDTIIIPSTGLEEFRAVIEEAIQADRRGAPELAPAGTSDSAGWQPGTTAAAVGAAMKY